MLWRMCVFGSTPLWRRTIGLCFLPTQTLAPLYRPVRLCFLKRHNPRILPAPPIGGMDEYRLRCPLKPLDLVIMSRGLVCCLKMLYHYRRATQALIGFHCVPSFITRGHFSWRRGIIFSNRSLLRDDRRSFLVRLSQQFCDSQLYAPKDVILGGPVNVKFPKVCNLQCVMGS
jgi:hypothetical protein